MSPPRVASSKRNVPPLTIESIFLRLIWLSTSATHIASTRINVARFSTVAFIALFPFSVGSYLRWRKKEEFFFFFTPMVYEEKEEKEKEIYISTLVSMNYRRPLSPLSLSSSRES